MPGNQQGKFAVKPIENTTPPAIVQTAEHSAATLRAAFEEFNTYGRKRLEAAILVGAILAERKAHVGHGNWLPWLKQHFPYGRERAADFLRVWANRGKCCHAESFEEALVLCRPVAEPPPEPRDEPAPECGRAATFDPPEVVADAATSDPDDDRGDAWDPPELEEEPGDEPPPQSDEMPRPAFDVSRPADPPSYFKPGGKAIDPDHPFKDLLTRFTALSAAVTKAMQTEKGQLLRDYLSVLSKHSYRVRMVYHLPAVIEGDESRPARAKFVGLQALRKLIDKAGTRKKPMSEADVLRMFAELCEEEPETGDDE